MNPYEYGNKTAYGIESDALRYTWAGYFLTVIASSLIGDTAILIASIRYDTFKLHEVMTVIIQHIAVCDLMVTVMDVCPRFVSVTAGEWTFGTYWCYLLPYAAYYLNPVSILLICAMTTFKLLLMKYPDKFEGTTIKQAHRICWACWLAGLTFPVSFYHQGWDDIQFSYRIYHCNFVYSKDIWRSWLKPLLGFVFLFIPTCLVVVNTIYMLMIAKSSADQRDRGSLNWQGIMATVLTATFYCISVLPTFVYAAVEGFVHVHDKSKSFFHVQFYRVIHSFIFLNTMSNFFIYCLTVLSFRDFVKAKLARSYQFFTRAENVDRKTSTSVVVTLIASMATAAVTSHGRRISESDSELDTSYD
ncbi:allatostatin-A receptor-like [Bolinopsis microptera]|uniref:allatostatin-A receptor-like n=1 Tax=Bolinopsis microptera TaxID=2820187 RepID=UPI00307A05CF